MEFILRVDIIYDQFLQFSNTFCCIRICSHYFDYHDRNTNGLATLTTFTVNSSENPLKKNISFGLGSGQVVDCENTHIIVLEYPVRLNVFGNSFLHCDKLIFFVRKKLSI